MWWAVLEDDDDVDDDDDETESWWCHMDEKKIKEDSKRRRRKKNRRKKRTWTSSSRRTDWQNWSANGPWREWAGACSEDQELSELWRQDPPQGSALDRRSSDQVDPIQEERALDPAIDGMLQELGIPTSSPEWRQKAANSAAEPAKTDLADAGKLSRRKPWGGAPLRDGCPKLCRGGAPTDRRWS